jgi:hypothetical protein
VPGELPPGTPGRSRVRLSLERAPRSPCPHCGRETKTVSGGICADCWGVKDPEHAVVVRPPPRTERLFDWDFSLFGLDSGYHVAGLAIALVVLIIGVALGLR